MFPASLGPNSTRLELRGPVCVLVDFADVDLGVGECDAARLFVDQPVRGNWFLIFREEAYSSSEERVRRKQFPLILAWAMTVWKAQRMILNRVGFRWGNLVLRFLAWRVRPRRGLSVIALLRSRRFCLRILIFKKPCGKRFQESLAF
jgi:hypothetical protein